MAYYYFQVPLLSVRVAPMQNFITSSGDDVALRGSGIIVYTLIARSSQTYVLYVIDLSGTLSTYDP